jgi:hypothetical protein
MAMKQKRGNDRTRDIPNSIRAWTMPVLLAWLAFAAVGLRAAEPAAAPAAAAPAVAVDLKEGQYQVKTPVYEAIVPPSGLMSYLKVGSGPMVILERPLRLNVHPDRFGKKPQYLCPQISRPEPSVLVCDGPQATLRYAFGRDSIEMTITAKREGIDLFMPVNPEVEGLRIAHPERGEQIAVGGRMLAGDGMIEYHLGGMFLRVSGGVCNYAPTTLSVPWMNPGQKRVVRLDMGSATPEQRAKCDIPPLYAGPLTVLSPLDYQVFQRRTRESGAIRVTGKVKVPCDRVEFRRGDGDWQPVALDAAGGAFFATLPAPAGGWYRCDIRALKDGQVVAARTIERVGVGEVFVVAGQSNSTNCGDERQRPDSGRVSTFSGWEWRVADDPQPAVHDASGGGSPWPAFGDALVKRCGVPVGIVSTGHGGTSVEQWRPGGELFEWLQQRILQLGPGGFRMVLWHQGENNGGARNPGPVADDYQARLRAIIEQSNARAGWTFPWMVAVACARSGQMQLAEAGEALLGPDTDALQGDYRGRPGNQIHFSVKGLRRHGELWAEKVGEWLDVFFAK